MPFSDLYRRLFEKKKEIHRKTIVRKIHSMFVEMNRTLRIQFMQQLVHAILQHEPTDDLHHYLSDCTPENFVPILTHLLNYGMLDSMCLHTCTQYVLGRGPFPSRH